MYKLTLLTLSLVMFTQINSQEIKVPNEARPFIIAGYEMLDYQVGDLNGDNKPDAILVLKNPGEDSLNEEELSRTLLILIRQANGKLKQALRNDEAIMGRHSGGVFGDPYDGITIKRNGFNISFYGGSSWRWSYNYEFRWNAAKKNWILFKESEANFNSGDPEKTMTEFDIEANELGEITIEKFTQGQGYEESKWKVIAEKTFFYTNPKIGSKPRQGYLIKGDIATGTRQLKNFVEVSFENKDGIFTSGFILKKDMVSVK